jgi:hypothetical protein
LVPLVTGAGVGLRRKKSINRDTQKKRESIRGCTDLKQRDV